ncbi:MAG: hypothetical protein IJ705_04595, partial [Oscillospiraceae bacterium]|nr:hypothetical protein [Oscillospiraceae bacterium]
LPRDVCHFNIHNKPLYGIAKWICSVYVIVTTKSISGFHKKGRTIGGRAETLRFFEQKNKFDVSKA